MELKAQCQHINLHEEFKAFLDENGLVQEVIEPTREKNILDLIATNIHERVNKTEVLPGISDHRCTLIEISMRVNRRKQAPHKIYLYKRADWQGLRDYISTNITSDRTSIEDTWTQIKTTIQTGVEKFIPSKMSKKRKSLPYISAALDKKMALRDRLERDSKKTGRPRPSGSKAL